MFDELHDPSPTTGDAHQLAAVAERARVMRRRRNALVVSLGVIATLVGGAVILASLDRGDEDRVVTLSSPSSSAPLAPTTTPAGADPTTPDATTALPTTSDPAITSTTFLAPPDHEGVPLDCGDDRRCTFDHLADGRLVQVGSDGGESGPATFTIYDETATEVDATGLLGDFDSVGAYLVDIGPGDIAYVWYTRRDESETAHLGAFELTGPNAGQQIEGVDALVDFSGDTEQVPTRDGFVEVGCCGMETTRPAPAEPLILPWVDSNGTPIGNPTDTFFSVTFVDQTMTVTATQGDNVQSWSLPDQEIAMRGFPSLFQLDDGRVFYEFESFQDGGSSRAVAYLNPDGTIDSGVAVGVTLHVLPDGRAVWFDFDDDTYTLVTLPDPVDPDDSVLTLPTVGPNQTTTTTPPAAGVARPLVAITGDGDAVYFDGDDAERTVIFDGPAVGDTGASGDGNSVARVSVSTASGTAWVGLCCAPIVGTLLETDLGVPAVAGDPPTYGNAPVPNPSGSLLATEGSNGFVEVRDPETGASFSAVATDPGFETSFDLMWIDDVRLAVLGNASATWSLTVFAVEGDVLAVESSRVFSTFSAFPGLRFAGTAIDGELAVHDVGTDTVLSGAVDDYGNNSGDERGSSLQVITLPAAAQSAWFADPGQLIWVDVDGVLRVGDRTIPGVYTWARR